MDGWANKLVTVFACSCIYDNFVMVVAPGHPTSLRYVGQSAHLHAIKILHHDRFLAPR